MKTAMISFLFAAGFFVLAFGVKGNLVIADDSGVRVAILFLLGCGFGFIGIIAVIGSVVFRS